MYDRRDRKWIWFIPSPSGSREQWFSWFSNAIYCWKCKINYRFVLKLVACQIFFLWYWALAFGSWVRPRPLSSTPSSTFIITQPESWYSFYRPAEGRRLSAPVGTALRMSSSGPRLYIAVAVAINAEMLAVGFDRETSHIAIGNSAVTNPFRTAPSIYICQRFRTPRLILDNSKPPIFLNFGIFPLPRRIWSSLHQSLVYSD